MSIDDYGSVVETESVTTGFEEFNFGVDQSPESFPRGPVSISATSPETVDVVSASLETGSCGVLPEGNFDGASSESGKELMINGGKKERDTKSASGRHWWWKQENSEAVENGVIKDYVMEWIRMEIKKERPKSDWIGAFSSSNQSIGKTDKKKNRKRLDWWVSLNEEEEEKILKNKEKRRPPREWWKQEYCEELERKKKKRKRRMKREMGMKSESYGGGGEEWWPRDEELYVQRKKKRSRSSRGSNGWFSGELFRGIHNSHDSLSGEIPKSGGISSTPSMRRTAGYVAPEYGGGGQSSDKPDVYSYGVLLLVVIAGRRLLQKSPARRPSMKQVVAMLTCQSEARQLPFEFSPSPSQSPFPFKSRSH